MLKTIKAFVLLASGSLLIACSILKPVELPHVQKYTFSSAFSREHVNHQRKVVAINVVNNYSIFNTEKIVYVKVPGQVGNFVKHEWADTPAKLLEPVILNKLQNSNAQPVLYSNFLGKAQYVMNVQIIKLQQLYYVQPARAQVQIKVDLIDNSKKLLIASFNFSGDKDMYANNPTSGVQAINTLINTFATKLLLFVNKKI